MLRITIFVVAIHALVISGLLSVGGIIPPIVVDIARAVPILLGLLFVSVGNLLPRTRPNLVIGIRTAAALADAHIWKQLHRVAGYVSVALGAVLIVAGGLMSPGPHVAGVVGAAGTTAFLVIALYSRRRSRV